MALQTSIKGGCVPEPHLFDVNRLPPSANRLAPTYRCQGCGDEVVYDSLAACCRCCDECYADNCPSPAVQRCEK